MVQHRHRIRLSAPTYGEQEADAVASVIRSGQVTQGKRVRAFEERMLAFLKAEGRAALMVNSGSSANLLAAEYIADKGGEAKREVVTTALTWSTTIAPLLQKGLRPVFVDVGDDLTMSPVVAQSAVEAGHESISAILPVHLLGHPANMGVIGVLAENYGLVTFEDCCEALGAKWAGRSVGTFGDLASFSYYFSHHASAIEGGLLVHKPDMRFGAWREHGWIRNYPPEVRAEMRAKHPDLDERWIFDQAGYNLRSTEINAALALLQLRRQAAWQRARIGIAEWYAEHLQHPGLRHPFLALSSEAAPNPFSYALIVQATAGFSKQDLAAWLEKRGVETRPIMSGNITRHPWLARQPGAYRIHGSLTQTEAAHERGILLPCHPGLTPGDLRYVRDAIAGFLDAQGAQPLQEADE